MKKVILGTIMCIFISGISVAQRALDQGSIALAGSVSFTNFKADGADASTNTFTLFPNMMYNVVERLGIGAGVLFRTESFDGNNTRRDIFFGPFIRYTFSNSLPFFAEFQYSFGSVKIADADGVPGSNIRPAIGYSIFLDKVGSATLEPSFFFNHGRVDGDAFGNTIGLSINFAWNFVNISGK